MDSQTLIFMIFISLIIILFSVLSWLLIKRNKNRFSFSLAMYFITTALGLAVNLVYRLVDNFTFNIVGNLIVIYLATFAGIHLLSFNLLLVRSSKTFSIRRQWIISIGYAILLLGLVLIHFITSEGIQWQFVENGPIYGLDNPISEMPLDPERSNPIYSDLFGFYGLIVSQILWITIIITSIKIKSKMGSNIYGKKYIKNILGILFFDAQLISAYLAHTSNNEILRMVAVILQFGLIPGTLLLYSGLKRAPE